MTQDDPRQQEQPSKNTSGPGVLPEPQKDLEENQPQARRRPDPTRYGDWEKSGRCIDF